MNVKRERQAMSAAAIEEVADRFFSAIERGDFAALRLLYSDSLRAWHSYDNATQNKAENIATLSGLSAVGASRYQVLERQVVGGRLIQRHVLTFLPHDGSPASALQAAIFLSISDKRIDALDEYLDSRAVGELLATVQRKSSAI